MTKAEDNKEFEEIDKQINDLDVNMNKKEDNLKEEINKKSEIIKDLQQKLQELTTFKYQMSFLLKNFISNLDSFIINSNYYNSSLKSWINSKSKISANLLYRLTRDGPEISTFHKLCDNKGPTLILFQIKEGDKVGFFVNESFDSSSGWKNDKNTFIFNLNQNKQYKRYDSQNPESFICEKNCGPSVNGFGCNPDKKLNVIYHSANAIDNFFYDGSKLLPTEDSEKEYEVSECEIFQIIIT